MSLTTDRNRENRDDFEERLQLLQTELQRYGKDIIQHISALHCYDDATVDFKNSPRKTLEVIAEEYVAI